jgi:hypothetical protein
MLEEFALTVDYTHGMLYQISLKNAEVRAIDLPTPNYPMSAIYDTKRHDIYWTDFQRYQILQSTIWGQNKSVVFNTGGYESHRGGQNAISTHQANIHHNVSFALST